MSAFSAFELLDLCFEPSCQIWGQTQRLQESRDVKSVNFVYCQARQLANSWQIRWQSFLHQPPATGSLKLCPGKTWHWKPWFQKKERQARLEPLGLVRQAGALSTRMEFASFKSRTHVAPFAQGLEESIAGLQHQVPPEGYSILIAVVIRTLFWLFVELSLFAMLVFEIWHNINISLFQ